MHAMCVAIHSIMKKARMNVCCALQDITLLMKSTAFSAQALRLWKDARHAFQPMEHAVDVKQDMNMTAPTRNVKNALKAHTVMMAHRAERLPIVKKSETKPNLSAQDVNRDTCPIQMMEAKHAKRVMKSHTVMMDWNARDAQH